MKDDEDWERGLLRTGTPTPVAPHRPRLFEYLYRLQNLFHLRVQTGYPCAGPPSPLVYASRPILSNSEDPQAWEATHKDGAVPATPDSPHSTAARPRASRTSTSHSISSRDKYGYDR